MEVTVEILEGLERKVYVVVPFDRIEEKIREKLEQTAKTAKINGFRPGKVPISEIKRRYGQGIRQEVSGEVIQSSFAEAVQKESLNPAGMPKIDDVKMQENEDLEYTATIEVFPEIELNGLDDIEIEKLESEILEADVDEMVETVREQRLDYELVERAAKEKDKVNMDFEGFVDGEPFEGGKADGADVIIGSGQMIPGFEDGLIGLNLGEEKEIEVTFPEKYQSKELAGKDAKFKIRINGVHEPKKPDMDEKFFESFGLRGNNDIETFRSELQENMQKELEKAVEEKLRNQIMDSLVEKNEILVPKALVEQEAAQMREQMIQQYGGGVKIEPGMLPAEMFSDQAEKRVKNSLLIGALVEQNGLVADEEKTRKVIDEIAADYDDPEQVRNYYLSNEEQLNQARHIALERQMVDFVMSLAKVSSKTVPYKEAVAREQNAPQENA